jgi:hypothetical protein
MPESPVKDKNYNLINVLHRSLENAWRMETYIQDAEREGDAELADWFRKIQENSRRAGDQGKQMLAKRLQSEPG